QYTTFTDAVEDIFLLYGSDIAMLQRRIDSPLDWLRTLLAMPENERATLRSTLDEFIGKLLPVEPKATGGYPAVLAAGQITAEASQGLILAGALLKVGTGELPLTPGVDLPVVVKPWYEETT
ncbi:MAG: hypothetical protein MUP40_07085, partial [Actinobacteria bacterium]|nr:hypothetical protein [Actinomycetota bacterium]